jgi:hypothetical protein
LYQKYKDKEPANTEWTEEQEKELERLQSGHISSLQETAIFGEAIKGIDKTLETKLLSHPPHRRVEVLSKVFKHLSSSELRYLHNQISKCFEDNCNGVGDDQVGQSPNVSSALLDPEDDGPSNSLEVSGIEEYNSDLNGNSNEESRLLGPELESIDFQCPGDMSDDDSSSIASLAQDWQPILGGVFKEADHEEVRKTMQQDSPIRDDDDLQEEIMHLEESQVLMQGELKKARAELFFASLLPGKEPIAAEFPEKRQAQLPRPPSKSNPGEQPIDEIERSQQPPEPLTDPVSEALQALLPQTYCDLPPHEEPPNQILKLPILPASRAPKLANLTRTAVSTLSPSPQHAGPPAQSHLQIREINQAQLPMPPSESNPGKQLIDETPRRPQPPEPPTYPVPEALQALLSPPYCDPPPQHDESPNQIRKPPILPASMAPKLANLTRTAAATSSPSPQRPGPPVESHLQMREQVKSPLSQARLLYKQANSPKWFKPNKPPIKQKDGTFIRPRGQAKKWCTWDKDNGLWRTTDQDNEKIV